MRDELIRLADEIQGIVLFVTNTKNKQVLIATSDALVSQQHSGKILKTLLKKVGGKGGGNARLAGGNVIADINTIIRTFERCI